jgi:hypothetical protein
MGLPVFFHGSHRVAAGGRAPGQPGRGGTVHHHGVAQGEQALGLGVSLVLVHVVNPQSFHWTMDLALPWARLLALCAAVVLAGTLTAWLAGQAAASRDAVRSVKEDW